MKAINVLLNICVYMLIPFLLMGVLAFLSQVSYIWMVQSNLYIGLYFIYMCVILLGMAFEHKSVRVF